MISFSHDVHRDIVLKKLRKIPTVCKSVFKKHRFADGLVWTTSTRATKVVLVVLGRPINIRKNKTVF